VIGGIAITVPTVYIPSVNVRRLVTRHHASVSHAVPQINVFKHGPIDQEWILVGISVIIFVAGSEIYKAIKRACMAPSGKYVVQAHVDPAGPNGEVAIML